MSGLLSAAKRCIDCAEPEAKVALTRKTFDALREGRLSPADDGIPPEPIGSTI